MATPEGTIPDSWFDPPLPDYVYASLPDPATHIRLIEIAIDHTDAPSIRISIYATPLDSAPPYQAVSYTWGVATGIRDLLIHDGVDEKRLVVGTNCADVLQQLAHFKITKYYWVDAICINQTDAKEKGYQVGMMGEIFSRAECVLACLGVQQNDDEFLVDMLNDFDRYLDAQKTSTIIFMARGSLWGAEESGCLETCEEWLEALSDENTLRLCKALDDLAQHPYFKRVWVLQEMFLARRLRIFLGLDEVKLTTLLFWWRDSKAHWFFHEIYHTDFSYKSMSKQPGILSKKLRAAESGEAYLADAHWTDPTYFEDFGGSLLDAEFEEFLQDCVLPVGPGSRRTAKTPSAVVLICQHRHCLDPRDTVYGTLALADWSRGLILTPDGSNIPKGRRANSVMDSDYTKSPFELAKEVMLRFTTVSDMWNVMTMLRLGYRDTEVLAGADKRNSQYSVPTVWDGTEDNFIHSAKQSPQNQVLIVEGGVQVTRDGPWTHELTWVHDGQYTRILGPNGMVNGVASAGVQCGDWLVPTSRCYGVVLRQSVSAPRYYDIVGRLSWTSLSMPETPGLTAFMIWFGVEDLLVHIVCGSPFFLEYASSDELGKGLGWAPSIPFCAQPRSSFAEIPMEPRQWSKEEFRMGGETIRSAMLEDWRRNLPGQQSNFKARSHGG